MSLNEQNNIKSLRKYLKVNIIENNITFRRHNHERQHVYDIISNTILKGESHSALMIGPKGSGKTTLINSVLNQLSRETDLENDAIIVQLHGTVHYDDKTALKAITTQMQLENAVGDKVFGTFAENLSFLLSCLKSGMDRRCKSIIFILNEFDLFCHKGNKQTLLYNLFDITESEQAPVCVIGVTSSFDVMDFLEKRVKSRFSHRYILLQPHNMCANKTEVLQNVVQTFVDLLSVEPVSLKPTLKKRKTSKVEEKSVKEIPKEVLSRCNMVEELDASFVEDWNAHVKSVSENQVVVDALEKFSYYFVNEQIFRDTLFQIVSKLSPSKPYLDPEVISSVIDNVCAPEHTVASLQSLSILELSLIIAMKHGLDIFQGQPMNFEMVLNRYSKFADKNSSAQKVPRPVILKAWEHLQALELVVPLKSGDSIYHSGDTTASRVRKEFQPYTLAVQTQDIDEAIKTFKALPTEINQWYYNVFL